MNDDAIMMLASYLDEYLTEPKRNWPADEFQRRTYERWIVNEIIEELVGNPFKQVEDTIRNYILRLYRCIQKVEDFDRYYMFYVALEELENLLQAISI